MARAENSTAIQDGSPLVKLYSIVTGQEIVGCPSTVAEVKGLHSKKPFFMAFVVLLSI